MLKQLERLEVPRVSIDLSEDTLSGQDKLAVLKYLDLDQSIAQIGRQKFGANMREFIPIKPVRDWVMEKWQGDTLYDLSHKDLPITFRTSLAIAMFTSRIADYLCSQGQVEVYASPSIQKAFTRHNLPSPQGLFQVDYAALPTEIKNELVMPLIGNLFDVLAVSKARYLFPGGVNTQALLLHDVSFLFTAARYGRNETISFNQIENLEAQARAARACLGNYQKIKTYTGFVKEIDKAKESERDMEQFDPKDYDLCDKPRYPDYFAEPGITFLDIYPYKKGETPEDVKRSYQRITQGGYFQGAIENPSWGDYFEVHLDGNGKLTGWYGIRGTFAPEDTREEIDMLHERFPRELADDDRNGTIDSLIEAIESERGANKRALDLAQAKYSTTSFTVEVGFLEALTGRNFRKKTKTKELEEEKRLNKEMKKMLGEENSKDDDIKGAGLVVFDNQPVDKRTLEMDFKILGAIRDNYKTSSVSMDDFIGAFFGGHVAKDNIGDWLSSSFALLSTFRGLLTDGSEYFAVLGIEPTSDEAGIKRAYREIAKTTHPDLLPGLSPKDQLQAVDKFIKATEAYDNLMNKAQNGLGDSLSPTFYLGRISKLFPTNQTPS